jgi:hypothetical protein
MYQLNVPLSIVTEDADATHSRYSITTGEEELASTVGNNIATTSSVSGTLKGIILLSNGSPQHSGAIRVGYSIEVEAKSSC